jgi:type I restriction enzyme S subunit
MSNMTLKDCCIFQEGYVNPPQSNRAYFNGPIKWLRASDLNDGVVYNTEKSLSRNGFDSAGKSAFLFKRNTIAISKSGTIGRLGILKDEMCGNRAVINIDVDGTIADLHYIFYLLKYKKNEIVRKAEGSIQKNLYVSALETISLNHKEKGDQQKIASVLSSLDNKIERNNRINAELEAMAKTLYDYWFVQFDFPDKYGKPYRASGGKMVWNEQAKRNIPDGWEVQKMAEWLDIDKSGDWGKEEAEGNFTQQVICFRGADINGLNGLDELKPPIRFIHEKNSFKILKSHDLIIEISGGSPTQSTGRLAFITDATIKRFGHPLICSNFCKPVSMRDKKLLYNFFYYWNSLYENGVFFGYEGKTSGIKNLLFESFISSYYTVVPDVKIVDKFYDIMDNFQERKQTALAENQKLTELRDWLLPMLMNGQVKVKNDNEVELLMAAEQKLK